MILDKLKNEFCLTNKNIENDLKIEGDLKIDKNPFEEINKKAEEFTNWFLNNYLESIKND